jgi:hypothetical protein
MIAFAQNWQRTSRSPTETCRVENDNIEHFSSCGTSHHVVVKTKDLTRKKILSVRCRILVQRQRKLVNCIRVACEPSHIEIGNFLQPRPWKRGAANDNSR